MVLYFYKTSIQYTTSITAITNNVKIEVATGNYETNARYEGPVMVYLIKAIHD